METKTTVGKGNVAKIKTKSGGEYSYKYTDLAQIHNYLEENNMKYYQFIDRVDGDDYIMTTPIIDGVEQTPRRGLRIVQPNPNDPNNNVYQVQGIGTTYERRYSLLMAFGLATEDDDASGLSTKEKCKTKEEALKVKITFGKYNGETLEDIQEDTNYLNWILEKSKDEYLKSAVEFLVVETTDEDIMLMSKFMAKMEEAEVDLETVLQTYNVTNARQLTKEQKEQCIRKFDKKIKELEKEPREMI